MKIKPFISMLLSVFILTLTPPVQASEFVVILLYKGQVLDGPFKGETIKGSCELDSRGDIYQQKAKCKMTLSSGLNIIDKRARVEVTSSNQALSITLGATLGHTAKKGNFKLAAFKATTYFKREISLLDIPREFSSVEVSIGGVSIVGGQEVIEPECLIWDVVGGSM